MWLLCHCFLIINFIKVFISWHFKMCVVQLTRTTAELFLNDSIDVSFATLKWTMNVFFILMSLIMHFQQLSLLTYF